LLRIHFNACTRSSTPSAADCSKSLPPISPKYV
jgi:hypothetical protein